MRCTGSYDCEGMHFCDPHTSICHSCDILCESYRDSVEECRHLCPRWKQQNNTEMMAVTRRVQPIIIGSCLTVFILIFVGICVYCLCRKNKCTKQKKTEEICDQRNHSGTVNKQMPIGCEEGLLQERQNDSMAYKQMDNVEIIKDATLHWKTEKERQSMLHSPSVDDVVQTPEKLSVECAADKYHCIREECEDEFSAKEETKQNQLALPSYSEITIPKTSWNENAEKNVQSVNISAQHDENMLMRASCIRPCPHLNSIELASDNDNDGSVCNSLLSLHLEITSKDSISCQLDLRSDQEPFITSTERENPGGNNNNNNRSVFNQVVEVYEFLNRRMPELPLVKGLMIGNGQLHVLVCDGCDLTEVNHQIMNVLPSTMNPNVIRVNYLSEYT